MEILRLVLPIFACFTTYFLLVSMGHRDSFLARQSTSIWFFLYGADSLVGLFYCWKLRQQLHNIVRSCRELLYQAQALILGLYGLGLLFAAPIFGQQLWPWPLDPFHSHLYSGVFFSGAVGMVLQSSYTNRSGRLSLGLTQAVLGFSIVYGNWLVDQQVHQLDWSSVSPWLWQFIFFAFGCLGAWVTFRELKVFTPTLE